MDKEPRVNSTSLRFSKRVENVMNNVPGKTFGDKFEYIVLDYQEKREEREAYFGYSRHTCKNRPHAGINIHHVALIHLNKAITSNRFVG